MAHVLASRHVNAKIRSKRAGVVPVPTRKQEEEEEPPPEHILANDKRRRFNNSLQSAARNMLHQGNIKTSSAIILVLLFAAILVIDNQEGETRAPSFSGRISKDGDNAVDCTQVRGEYGEWVPADYERIASTQYIPLMGFRQVRHMKKRKANNKQRNNNATKSIADDFLPQTTLAWKETVYASQCGASLQLMTLGGFCAIMEKRNMTYLFFVGDSMTQAMHVSFLGLMGIEHVPVPSEWLTSPLKPITKQRIRCPGDFSFRVISVRSTLYAIEQSNVTSTRQMFEGNTIDIVPGLGQLVIYMCYAADRLRGTAGPCPWMKELRDAAGRALVIVNGGASYHATSTFGAMWDGFLESLDTLGRPYQDLVYFRSVSPGHPNCFNGSIVTDYAGYEKYYSTSSFAWDQFQYYNQYVRKRLKERAGSTSSFVPVHMLNIYNMTALRPDGHSAAFDCLHYEHPGPVDWWNHLLYTNLLDAKELIQY